MDLFLAQNEARRRAGGMFTLTVCLMAGVILSVHVLAALCSGSPFSDPVLHQRLIVWTLPATLCLLLVGVIVRVYALRLGGSSVAKELGGRRLHPGVQDPDEKRLVAQVEELAVCCGVPVPEVWLLDREGSINAFAAGTDPSSTVVGVTRGALERLSPEELRAVLLHEFSHVLSGDMRLKFQMLAWVQGILFLSWAGRLMVFSDLTSGKKGARAKGAVSKGSGSRSRGVVQEPPPGEQSRSLLGVVLMLFGAVAGVFGRFLQSAIARDWEFAADASAAACLGSPAPVVAALRKIGGLPKRSFLESPTAPESGHLFFGQAWQGVASALFPTHPTLDDRIRILTPDWNGEYLASVVRKTPVEESGKGAESEAVAEDSHLSAAARAAAAIGARKREKAKLKESAQLNPSQGYPAANLPYLGVSMLPSQLSLAPLMKKSLREEWLAYTQTREGAKALLLEMMRPTSVPTSKLFTATTTQQLLLLDLAMPMLRRMSLGEYYLFLKQCRRELLRSEELDLVGYLLLHVARRRLALCLGVREIVPVVFEDVPSIWAETQVLISMLERSGAPTIAARNSAHLAAWASLGYENPPAPREGLTVLDLVNALEVCEQASPILKKRLLVACGLAASYQGIVSEKHMAILRMFADLLGSPVPHLSIRKMD